MFHNHMVITSILNNNAIIAKDTDGKEIVVFGTGIGFKGKKGQRVDESKIQCTYVRNEDSYTIPPGDIPVQFLELTNEIFELAKLSGLKNLKRSLFFALADHLYMAFERMNQGILMENPFLQDIMLYFPEEYNFARQCKPIIDNRLKLNIDENEIGYIALHLIEENKKLDNTNVKECIALMNKIINLASEELIPEDIDKESFQYSRLLMHVKLFAYRYLQRQELDDMNNYEIEKTLNQHFEREMKCIDKISEELYKEYGQKISKQDKFYLALHFKNCQTFR
ncbi:MAG: PRD domain-containing protein [Erysipelotrichaceae bacterium]|jgi:beta-glucoside operon transcriptional antiterminator